MMPLIDDDLRAWATGTGIPHTPEVILGGKSPDPVFGNKTLPELPCFLIGPEAQFLSLEKHIETTEGKQTVHRLYPRDFWLVAELKN